MIAHLLRFEAFVLGSANPEAQSSPFGVIGSAFIRTSDCANVERPIDGGVRLKTSLLCGHVRALPYSCGAAHGGEKAK